MRTVDLKVHIGSDGPIQGAVAEGRIEHPIAAVSKVIEIQYGVIPGIAVGLFDSMRKAVEASL